MWLLESRVKASIEHAEATGFIPSAEQQTQFMAAYGDEGDALTVVGGQAEIKVMGVLTKRPSLMAWLFGGGNATYTDIVDALARANADPRVQGISLEIDSPGGTFDGLFSVIAAMQAVNKPITAYVDGLAASAAYAIVSQADTIVAKDKSARFGSIGVVGAFSVNENSIEVTSTLAPKKRPDVTTEEGVAAVREELDAMHDLFVDSIAAGRKTTPANVNNSFGMGATLLADAALALGMIDRISSEQPTTNTNPAALSGKQSEINSMDLDTLKAQHPATFAAAVQEGVNHERDRVTAHVTMGEASGATEAAMAAIKDGSAMTATLTATYMAAGMNKRDVSARQADEPSADSVTLNTPAQTSDAMTVADMVALKAGVK